MTAPGDSHIGANSAIASDKANVAARREGSNVS